MAVYVVQLGAVYAWGMGSTKQLGQGDDEDDVFEPITITGKQLQNKFVFVMHFNVLVVNMLTTITYSKTHVFSVVCGCVC